MLPVSSTPVPIDASPTVLNPSWNEVFNLIASLVGSLAWPVVVIVLVYLFRGPLKTVVDGIAKRVGHIKKLTGPGGVGVEFDDEVEQAAELASELPVPTAEDVEADDKQAARSARSIPLELAKIDPGAAVVAAYIPVGEAMRDYVEASGEKLGNRSPISFVRRDKALPSELRALLLDLAALRNAAAHRSDAEISYESAKTYVESAERAAQQLRLISARLAFGFGIDEPDSE